MLTDGTGPVTRVMTALVLVGAGALTPAWALAQAAGTEAGLASTEATSAAAAPATSEDAISRATALMQRGRLIEARDIAAAALPQALDMSAEQRREIVDLIQAIDAKLRAADPVEVTLQRAEHAVTTGDLCAAEERAGRVLDRPGLNDAHKARAEAVIAQVAQRRAELAPFAAAMVDQAIREFEARRYAAAKAQLASVVRSGVKLEPAYERLVEQYQMRIVDLEQKQGSPFSVEPGEVTLSLFQPGTVRRTGENSQPAGEPGQPEQTQPAPAQEDLIQAAMRIEAERILAEADAAYETQRYREAADKYRMTLGQNRRYFTAEQIARAEQRLADAEARLGSNVGGDIGQQTIRDISLIRQRTQAMFDNEMERARRALDAGQTGEARELVARARLTVKSGESAFSEAEMEEFTRRMDAMNLQIDRTAEQIRIREQAEQERRVAEQARMAEQAQAAERDRRINEALDRIRALQREQKYEEALQVVEQVLFLDKNNPAGLLLRDALSDIIIYQRFNDIQRLKGFRHAGHTLDNTEAMLPPGGLYEYPRDWPAKSFLRGELAAYTESPEDRRVLAEIDNKRIPIDFNDNTLADVISFFQTVTQLDIDVDWDSLQEIGVERESLVTLKLTNVPVRVALERVLEKVSRDQFSRASWAVNHGVLVIAAKEQLDRQTTLVIYNITDLLLKIPNFYDAPQIDLQGVLQQSQGGGGGQSPFTNINQDQEDEAQREQERQERIEEIIDIIQNNVDYDGWRDNGGEVGTVQELNGSLIIRNTPRNHAEISGLLAKLREIRSMQINVETKFLLVNQDWFEQIGFDLDLVINSNNNQVRALRANDPTFQAGDLFDFSSTGPGGQRGLLRSVTSGGAQEPTTGQPEFLTQGVPNPRSWSPIGAGQNSLGLAAGLASGNDFATSILQSAPALGIAGQFLDDIQVDFLIVATQADRRAVQLTAPRMTFTNGQVANIFVVTQQAFVSDLEPVVGDSAVGFDPEVSVASEGVTMSVEGVISADRRYVTMTIDAGVSRIDGFGREPVTAVAGGQLVNSADTQSFIQLPTITVTRVRTTVTVPDEGTILLGGQRLVTELEIETGVPVLSKIPIINRFFTNRIDSKEEQTLLILLKPTIIIMAEEEERAFPGLADQLRTGLGR
jgi:type II secretory pathway component GspD/PulD (secretin)